VVGFPNFAYIKSRIMLFFQGRSPITPSLPYRWYDTPNVRFLSVSDFTDFSREKHLRVLAARYLDETGEIRWLPNLRALNAIFVLAKGNETSVGAGAEEAGGKS
jgi:methionine biosynthesis protein MetW